jgi:C-terminal processing protease CtpA/Prc
MLLKNASDRMQNPPMRASAFATMLVLLATSGCHLEQAASATSPPRIANLHAFARLYGVVRWFHASDAAATIDWDRFAVEGVRRVIDAPDTRSLRVRLGELFAPLAPTVCIVSAGEACPDQPALHPSSTVGLDMVFWQHQGYGDSVFPTSNSTYVSKRRHRDRSVRVPTSSPAALSQSVDAIPYRGAIVRLRGRVRAAHHGQGRLWLRVDRGTEQAFYDDMAKRPVLSDVWTSAEITTTIDAAATEIVFGEMMSGTGVTWYDDLELSVQAADGAWTPIAIQNGDFESADPLQGWTAGTAHHKGDEANYGWSVAVDHDHPASGTASLRIEHATKLLTQELFDDAPSPGEIVDIELGSGLRARVPISLYSKDGHTLGDDPQVARARQATSVSGVTGFDVIAEAADVIVLWNVLEHFWPYWNDVSVDWHAQLDAALNDALDDRDVDDHVMTLKRLAAAAPDGHMYSTCPGQSERASPPFAVELIEGQVVVTASADANVERGDVIVSIDGQPATRLLAIEEALASGSPQSRRFDGLARLGRGPLDARLALRVRRGGGDVDVTVARTARVVSEEPSRPAIERLEDGVYYVDLSRVPMPALDEQMNQLATAPAVVFDLRGRPNGNQQILSHLLTNADTANAWMAVPRLIRPDRAAMPASWMTSGWHLQVLQPHIAGRVAFITNAAAISYTESVMGIVDHYHLGAIVGSATSGANGDVAQVMEPSGCTTIFTARRVTKLDGSRHHLVGTLPTIPASRTIAGVRAGRDELFEKALAYVRDPTR